MQKNLLFKEFQNLENCINLLDFSIKKFNSFQINKDYTPDELEYYDSLSFRFEKNVELLLNFMRGLELYLFSVISDTLRDRLLVMQKIEIIDNIDFWLEARLLRNKIAHAYLPKQIKEIYDAIYEKSKVVFLTIDKIKNYFIKIGIIS